MCWWFSKHDFKQTRQKEPYKLIWVLWVKGHVTGACRLMVFLRWMGFSRLGELFEKVCFEWHRVWGYYGLVNFLCRPIWDVGIWMGAWSEGFRSGEQLSRLDKVKIAVLSVVVEVKDLLWQKPFSENRCLQMPEEHSRTSAKWSLSSGQEKFF